MLQSMTAFARVQKEIEEGYFCWELKSVNHRYLDVSFRLPEAFRFLEPQLRQLMRGKISRGKVECQLKFQETDLTNQSLTIHSGRVDALVHLSHTLASSHHVANDLGVSSLLSWPGVVQPHEIDGDALSDEVLSLFETTITQLIQMRAREGCALKSHVEKCLSELNREVTQTRDKLSLHAEHLKNKLLDRLHAVQLEVQESRVEQEIALILARSDVREELDRLQIHIKETNRALNCDKIAGRRLDFLMQELNREVNTLSSKLDSAELTQSAVDMKVFIEQMREQIQNIE